MVSREHPSRGGSDRRVRSADSRLARLLAAGLALSPVAARAADVTAERIIGLERGGDQWLSHGRGYVEQRYVPLDQINDQNVNQLGLAFSLDFDTDRGFEATPLVADGVLYTSMAWSQVVAIDARTGKILWHYNPQVDRAKGNDLCCDAVNRGVALWGDKVFVGTVDGRLVALDRGTGKVVWQQQTFDPDKPYTITGAPRVVKGKVVIGNGGAEFGVRGFFSAYDADTGKLLWRFYTVPGDPSKPYEHPELEMAAKTWTGDAYWKKYGGGGTVWDSMAYDPELDLLYVGTGNGSPWNRTIRSPGGGDNLFLSSILAIKPDTGRLAWYYQVTPGDAWDFTATQQMILADLEIDGATRKVLMQAPKNGFFYVLDRQTGKLISAEKFGKVTWAERIDLSTGRPVEAPGVRYEDKPIVMWPSPFGAHNWMSMSFNPKTGLVYIPYQEVPGVYRNEKDFTFVPHNFNTATGFSDFTEMPRDLVSGALVAWDPVRQKAAWRVPYPYIWNGGTLTTAGNLVFQGTAEGRFLAYAADSGKQLWAFPGRDGIVAAPVSYALDGQQYVAVLTGWAGAAVMFGGEAMQAPRTGLKNRLLVFKVGGTAKLEEPTDSAEVRQPPNLRRDRQQASAETIARGSLLYHSNCSRCHGVSLKSTGRTPDLRQSSDEMRDAFSDIVLKGMLQAAGMPSFAERLTQADVSAIKAYVVDAEQKALAPAQNAAAPAAKP